MLKSCSRCGKLHDFNYDCSKRIYRKGDSEADKFRSKSKWKYKSKMIKERDYYLCRCCLANILNSPMQFNYSNLEVHHIIPLNKDISKGLDDDNLITLCSYHHKLAEKGLIPIKILQKLTNKEVNLEEINKEFYKKTTPLPCENEI